ncbi:MAG: NYN domain-containing protein [Planctomycetes bacterium]|nr:NYN domain-containing protein [Planctomycetota bacterium]
MDGQKQLAVFIDFENLALGFRNQNERFHIDRVLARLVEKGHIVVKRAYADWKRFQSFTTELHESAIELIEIPRRQMTGKNSADIRLVVDAMDLCFAKAHIDTFAIVSGDSDFSPLVSKLKENGKHVIGLGMQASTSELLRDNCDEFIYYEDLTKEEDVPDLPELQALPERKRKCFALLLESLAALRRESRDVLWPSLIKETIRRKRPSFNEGYYGYKTFSRLLEDAASHSLVELGRDEARRSYYVTRFGAELVEGGPRPAAKASAGTPAPEAPEPAEAAAHSAKAPARRSNASRKAVIEEAPAVSASAEAPAKPSEGSTAAAPRRRRRPRRRSKSTTSNK